MRVKLLVSRFKNIRQVIIISTEYDFFNTLSINNVLEIGLQVIWLLADQDGFLRRWFKWAYLKQNHIHETYYEMIATFVREASLNTVQW